MKSEDTIYYKNTVIMADEFKKIKHRKKELKKIDWEIVRRLVTFLYYNSRVKKTNISMRCSMGYDRCIRYLNWMEGFDLIKKEFDEAHAELISLSEKGRALYKNKFNNIENF
jgi:predicted transcriptional regulator